MQRAVITEQKNAES